MTTTHLGTSKYYVYGHYDGDELVYIGKGSLDRAYRPYNRRNEEHAQWMMSQLPLLTVKIFENNLTQADAFKIEAEYINKHNPKYNIGSPCGEKHGKSKLTEDDVVCIKYTLFPLNISHSTIGDMFGVSAKTISAISSGTNWRHV